MYGGPTSRSNYQTYGTTARKETAQATLSRPKSEQRRQPARTPKEVNFEYDKNYQEKHKIESQYNVHFARRQLVTGMNIQVSDPRSS